MDGKAAQQHSSLLECLLFIAKYHGIGSSVQAVTSGLPLANGEVLGPELIVQAAQRLGLSVELSQAGVGDLPASLLPAIVLLRDERALVLLGREPGGGYRLADPQCGEGTLIMSAEELADLSADTMVLLRPRFQFDNRVNSGKGGAKQHWFWRVMLENAPVYRDVLLAAFFINLFALATPLFVMNVYDRVVPNFAEETLWALALGMLVLIVTDLTLRTMRGYFVDLAAQHADVKLSAAIMQKLLGLRLEVRPASVGSFASSLRSFEMVRDFIASASITTLVDLPFAVVFLSMIAWLAWPLTLPLLVAILVVLVYARIISQRMRSLSATAGNAAAQRNAILVETLTGLETVKALGAENHMQSHWERATGFLTRVTLQLRLLAASSGNLAAWAQHTAYVAVIVMGVYQIAQGELSLGGLIACSILTARALMPFAQLAALITQYHHAATALATLEEIMGQPEERPVGMQFLSRAQFKGEIEFRKVSFQYPGSEMRSVHDINLKIAAGEKVGILGRVGSGKSTLLRLALGLYQPNSGAVLVDGIDIRQLDPAELRNGFGYVPQESTLFYGTLRQNLLMFHPECDDAQLLQALNFAGLGEFVKTHPLGLDMLVGERGEALSGGQRKAVAVARGLVHRPNMLLLDEPTASMDNSTEQLLKRNLAKLAEGRTVLMISHHTALLELVDRLVVIDHGRIVADGPRAEVVEALRKGRIGGAR